MLSLVRLRWWVFAFLAVSIALGFSFYFDESVHAWIAQHQKPALRAFMQAVSRAGDWPGHAIVGSIGLLIAYLRRNRKWVRIFAAMLLACALAGTTTRLVKIVAGRARPDVQSEVQWRGLQLRSRYNAFPSGHTASSTAFFATLALTSWRIGLPLSVLPILIGFSRIYVVAHRLSDVIAAMIIGLLTAYCVVRWLPPESEKSSSET